MKADDASSPAEAADAWPKPDRPRDGERPFGGSAAEDASLTFIGRIRSAWTNRSDCPKNVRDARARGGGGGRVEIAARYRPALAGLAAGDRVFLLSWLHLARRDLALQKPCHAAGPRGTFSLRSPVRPNPIGLHLVRIVWLDLAAGRIGLDAIDVVDGTPLLDLKPFLPTVDAPPEDAGTA